MPTESLNTKDQARAMVNAMIPRGKFKVTADDGISYSIDGKAYDAEKGDEINLKGAVIAALLNEGSIEPVEE